MAKEMTFGERRARELLQRIREASEASVGDAWYGFFLRNYGDGKRTLAELIEAGEWTRVWEILEGEEGEWMHRKARGKADRKPDPDLNAFLKLVRKLGRKPR